MIRNVLFFYFEDVCKKSMYIGKRIYSTQKKKKKGKMEKKSFYLLINIYLLKTLLIVVDIQNL